MRALLVDSHYSLQDNKPLNSLMGVKLISGSMVFTVITSKIQNEHLETFDRRVLQSFTPSSSKHMLLQVFETTFNTAIR